MQTSLRILQLIDSLDTGGAEMMAVNISNALASDGKKVILCASRRKGELANRVSDLVTLACLEKRNAFDFRAFWRLVSLVKQHEIALIHAHSSSVFWALMVKVCTFFKVKVLWHDHYGNRIHEKANFFLILSSVWIDYILCVNNELCDWAQKNMWVDRHKVKYVNNFPSLSVHRVSKLEDITTLKIVYLASFRKPKNHLNLIKAFELYLFKAPLDSKLILAGRYHQDGYFDELHHYIQQNGLNEHIEISGNVTQVGALLAEVHLGVIASDFEGLPLSLLEYGQAELPVIVTGVGQCPEVVNFGEFGKVVVKNDPEGLADALLQTVKDWPAAVKQGQAFKNHVDQNYGVKNFLNIYQSLVEVKND